MDGVTRAWAVVTSAGVVRLGLGLVASLLIARGLGPADFGVYAVLAATVGIVGSLAEGGLTEAAVLRISAAWRAPAAARLGPPPPAATPDSKREASRHPSRAMESPPSHAIHAQPPAEPGAIASPPSRASDAQPPGDIAAERARAFFWLRLGLAAAVVSVACALAEPFARPLLGIDAGLTRWALIGIVATAASGAVSAMLQAIGAFGRMSSLTLVNTGLTAVLAVALLLTGRLDLWAALVILGIGTSLVTFAVGRVNLPRTWSLRLPPGHKLRKEAAALTPVGRWLWLASLFAMVAANAEILLLNRWAALPLVGAYGLALNLATKADVVNHSLYTVLLPGVATLRAPRALADYVRRGLLRSGLIAVGLVGLVVVAQPLIVLLYGADYAPAVPLFRLLLGVMIFDVLLTPVLLLPLAFQRPRLLAAGDATRAVTLVGIGLLLIPSLGAPGAIAARFASRVAGAVVVLGALWLGHPTLQVEHEEAAAVAQQRPAT